MASEPMSAADVEAQFLLLSAGHGADVQREFPVLAPNIFRGYIRGNVGVYAGTAGSAKAAEFLEELAADQRKLVALEKLRAEGAAEAARPKFNPVVHHGGKA